ncbi:sulfotransferase family 2 domain-containing protein [Mangrovimonas cancribranchiae]|uniref:Sulfotransferase family 2 domain-containing protein n=1 Tax=Mangrovimonas cancribranchiae TaxID=3080055 RepID=A0AAU6P299_9FLAO
MISHKKKLVFIHLPKCAGTSIEHALGHSEDYSGRSSQDHRSIRDIQPISLADIKYFSKDFLLALRYRYKYYKNQKTTVNPNNYITVNKKEYDEYFKFSFVRNPYHRAYSWYNGIMKDPVHRKQYNIDSDITFEEFLVKYLHKKRLMKPYMHFLKEYSGKIPLDFIGRFESLEDDFKFICDTLNIKVELPHKNNKKSFQKDYSKVYTEKSYNLITEYYKEDISYFNYVFE